MRLTRILYKQHIGRQLKKLWYVKRERKVTNTTTEQYLSKLEIPVKEASEVACPKQEYPK